MAEPITLAEARKHIRVDSPADDVLIEGYIVAAREWVEDYTGLVLSRREVTESVSGFTNPIKLRAWPIAADQPVSIAYRDRTGVGQTVANAVLRAASRPGTVYPAAGARWPDSNTVDGAIDVTVTAGFVDAGSIPQVLKQAMLVLLTAFYEDREGGEMIAAAERSARSLCRRYKRWTT
jgi:uncharacterized phiE125 gp8 family phage protein